MRGRKRPPRQSTSAKRKLAELTAPQVAGHAVETELTTLFRELVFALPYVDFQDKMPVGVYRMLVKLVILDRWWKATDDRGLGETDEQICKWLKVEDPAKLDLWRKQPEYKMLLHHAEAAMSTLGTDEEFKTLLESPKFQSRLLRRAIHEMEFSYDPRVKARMAEVLTDRIAPRLSKSETKETGGKFLVVSDEMMERLLAVSQEAEKTTVEIEVGSSEEVHKGPLALAETAGE